jgi:hypothetical protein
MKAETRTLTLAELGKPVFHVVSRGQTYRYEHPGASLDLTFDRLRWKYHELFCELTAKTTLLGARTVKDGILSQGSFNVSATDTRDKWAKRIQDRLRAPDVPVDQVLEDACASVLDADRASTASISLHDVDDDDGATLFTCDGIQLDLRDTNLWYGLPNSGKSLQAARTALELKREGWIVGYVDFEWGPEAHRKRAKKLYGPQFPDVRYLKFDRPLVQEIDGLRRTVANEGWDFCVIDSISFGCAGAPESAEVAAAFIQAVRQLRIGTLLVGHQNKSEGGDKYPFGSIFWYAAGRQIYHFRRANGDDPTTLVSGITHRKNNNGPERPPHAIEYVFADDRTHIRQVNPAGVEDIASTLPVRQRLRHALQAGPRRLEDLAVELDVPANTIVKTLTRDSKGKVRQFTRLPDSTVALFSERTA